MVVARRNGLPAFQDPSTSEEDEDIGAEDSEASDVGSEEDLPKRTPRSSPTKRNATDKGKGKAKAVDEDQPSNMIVQTSFDAYFTHNKPGRVQTSSNVFSELLVPLSREEYADAFADFTPRLRTITPRLLEEGSEALSVLFSRMMCELREGFNILCYGYGSKRSLLNQFAKERCAKKGHVVVANGFQPDFVLKDLLNEIDNTIVSMSEDIDDLPNTNLDKQAKRIHDFFSSSKADLYIIIHSIDASPFRSTKAKSILSLLALNHHIHIVASIDHINAPLLWSSSENFARKPQVEEGSSTLSTAGLPQSRGFAWLWHDLTTLRPYDFELSFADRSSLAGAHTGGARRKVDTTAAATSGAATISETAATHILASVTQKAQKLFVLLGERQLELLEAEGQSNAGAGAHAGMPYDVLFASARDNFVATNETALRALLGEFRDHGLIVSSQGGGSTGGGEMLWIPMRKERLGNILKTLSAA